MFEWFPINNPFLWIFTDKPTTEVGDMPHNTLTVGTWNIGNGTYENARTIASKVDALALQEASDQDRMLAQLKKDGYGLIRPNTDGAPATPVLFNKTTMTLKSVIDVLVFTGRNVGPGPGPEHSKTKRIVGGVFQHKSGEKIAFCSEHRLSGARPGNERERLQTFQAQKTAEYFDGFNGIVIIGADMNSEANSHTLKPMRDAGWTSDQIRTRIPTHGGWAPDHIWWKKNDHIRFIDHDTYSNKSDHDALVATFRLTP